MRARERSRLQAATPHARRAHERTGLPAQHLRQAVRCSRPRAVENQTAVSGRRLPHRRTTANQRQPLAADTTPSLLPGVPAATTGTARRRVRAATHVNPVPATVLATMGVVVLRVRN